jgi:hypothetical protein
MQLRELVPAHPHSAATQEGADSKRPKHVVLSDTIALVKELQGKVHTLPHTKGSIHSLVMHYILEPLGPTQAI